LAFDYYLLRSQPRLPLVLTLILAIVFNVGYPFAGFLPEGPARNSFDAIVLTIILLYLFSLTIFVRLRKLRKGGE
jgi:hypothetical protein